MIALGFKRQTTKLKLWGKCWKVRYIKCLKYVEFRKDFSFHTSNWIIIL